ncbi:hypothetical protein CEXT_647191 [Caerostris extrusa]|uniref:Uncharacterized protein n=1 Tax=Caerostris extrusa TaxID=172846 RepID=A0AAV4QMH2_CAEEX|nr:hypothetical protein CEXT_647191 [Caerostris extrusa]
MLFLVLLSAIALAHGSIIQQIVPVHAPQPYKFGYSIRDQNSQQYRDKKPEMVFGGVIGNYGFTDDRGIARQVNYVADDAGFRAQSADQRTRNRQSKSRCCPDYLLMPLCWRGTGWSSCSCTTTNPPSCSCTTTNPPSCSCANKLIRPAVVVQQSAIGLVCRIWPWFSDEIVLVPKLVPHMAIAEWYCQMI